MAEAPDVGNVNAGSQPRNTIVLMGVESQIITIMIKTDSKTEQAKRVIINNNNPVNNIKNICMLFNRNKCDSVDKIVFVCMKILKIM